MQELSYNKECSNCYGKGREGYVSGELHFKTCPICEGLGYVTIEESPEGYIWDFETGDYKKL